MVTHRNREWKVVDVASARELAEKFSEHTWTPCTGFRYAGFCWLNDSFSGNGAQEYAVIRESDGAQVESITVSWTAQRGVDAFTAKIEEWTQRWTRGEDTFESTYGHVRLDRMRSPAEHGRCHLCA